jgi:hypothetical protein
MGIVYNEYDREINECDECGDGYGEEILMEEDAFECKKCLCKANICENCVDELDLLVECEACECEGCKKCVKERSCCSQSLCDECWLGNDILRPKCHDSSLKFHRDRRQGKPGPHHRSQVSQEVSGSSSNLRASEVEREALEILVAERESANTQLQREVNNYRATIQILPYQRIQTHATQVYTKATQTDNLKTCTSLASEAQNAHYQDNDFGH